MALSAAGIFERGIVGQPSWDDRYQGDDYVYGTAANDFLCSQFGHLPKGRILCLAEGEGAEMMMDLDGLRTELAGLEFEYSDESVREVNEGPLHHGSGAVVRIRARKPQ